MKACIAFLVILFFTACSSSKFSKPSSDQNLFRADPTIFTDNENYYLYGTGHPNGFEVFKSTDLKNWKIVGMALKRGESFGTKGFWAPQVFTYSSKYYMAYTANESIAIASAESPAGPFRQANLKAIASPVRMIDPFIFFDGGKIYLYHVRLSEGNKIFVAELENDLSALKPETVKLCVEAEPGWEDSENVPWKVAEGPTVIRHNNTYYLIYSANDFRNPDYAIGYATASSPTGPWTKFSDNPILSKKEARINGTGHGDLFFDGKSRMQYVFHTHNADTSVAPRRTAIVQMKFRKSQTGIDDLRVAKRSFRFLEK